MLLTDNKKKQMKRRTRTLAGVLVMLIVIQFFPAQKNFSEAEAPGDIANRYEVPMNTLMNLYDGCYNCHSNYTRYPWYYKVQPVGWWMAYHISRAKRHLNFSEFASYTPREASRKFHEIHEVMEEHSMPLRSYRLMHEEAKLTPAQYQHVADWALRMQQEIDSTL